MGKFLKPRGIKGVLWVLIFNEVDSALKTGMQVWVELKDGVYSNHMIEALRISGNKSWIKLTGCIKHDDIDHLNGLIFSIPRSVFTSLSDNEIYLIDLIGCKVIDEKRNSIGLVVDTLSLPAQNLIVVKTIGNEVLIPFVDAHIMLFDNKNNILIVKDVEGLLD